MGAHLPPKLRHFVEELSAILKLTTDPAIIRDIGMPLLARLVEKDDWLPDVYAHADPTHYQQYLLYCDKAERFSVVSFVWAPGQATPIHDHQTWGLIGMLRGSEVAQRFVLDDAGHPEETGPAITLLPGEVDAVSPEIGDIHKVANASATEVSISIHVYGADIGKVERFAFDRSGRRKPFVSGYANRTDPNPGQQEGSFE